MQFLLCNGIRIFTEAFQTIESGTQSIGESCCRTWKHVQFEGASEDVSSQGEFYIIRRGRQCKIADKEALPCAYLTSDGGETRLLVIQKVSHDNPDFFMFLIVDGMDQNMTMVPKMRQIVKNIESRFVKTHLCEVLVHDIGLYANVWIDVHHKYDSNWVMTSVMHVIADVRRRKGRLPLTLQI